MKSVLAILLAACLPLNVLATDTPTPSTPPVSISLGSRHGQVAPFRQGFTHTGGGNIDVAQPAPDTIVITMTGVAVAGGQPLKPSLATMNFDLEQCFEISFDNPGVKRARLSMEGHVIGLLRSHKAGGGSAEQAPGIAVVNNSSAEVLTLTVPSHAVTGGENLSVNCREGPVSATITSGTYTLHGQWAVSVSNPKTLKLSKAASAEFAPDPALDPLWISYWEPFHGAAKKDLGFQITVKVAVDSGVAGVKADR